MIDEGFIDLRLNRQEGQVNESFWPSFTDIMTVIVMIFLIAMVVLLMRNMELVQQLRATMEAERVAAELARTTGQVRDSLEVELHSAEERIAALQLQLMRLQEIKSQQESSIASNLQIINRLTKEKEEASKEASRLLLLQQQLQTELDTDKAKLASAEELIAGLELNLDRLQTRLDESQGREQQLQLTISAQQRDIEAAQEQRQQADSKYMVLVGEYDDLKVKYDKLVRPARSAKGRYLVEVRYWKEGKKYMISYRENGTGNYKSISRTKLEKRLDALQQDNVNGLYVKVIFPDNSGLSYNEAWQFTSDMHKKYDYYYKSE